MNTERKMKFIIIKKESLVITKNVEEEQIDCLLCFKFCPWKGGKSTVNQNYLVPIYIDKKVKMLKRENL